jgi:hypothetical protein
MTWNEFLYARIIPTLNTKEPLFLTLFRKCYPNYEPSRFSVSYILSEIEILRFAHNDILRSAELRKKKATEELSP